MDSPEELIGRSPKITALLAEVRALLRRDAGARRLPPILITGETGTGKGLLAHVIHQTGARASGQFVEVNGAAIPEHLLESELFGYERGAFTDARQAKQGLLQVAHRGTLFLDEVALLPLALQAKLLKVLEDGTVRRLGSTRSEIIDVSFISATNEDLPALVRAKRFREDLYHRLAVITLDMPPLRERGDDIGLLAEQAVARVCAKYGASLKQLSPEASAAMRAYRWPGNVRELNGLIERAVLMCQDPQIPVSALRFAAAPSPSVVRDPPSRTSSADWERQRLSDVLTETGWNISRTADILEITRNTVRARIAKYGLRRSGRPESRDAFPVADDPDQETGAPSELNEGDAILEAPPGVSPVLALAGAPEASRGFIDALRGRPSIAVLPFRSEAEGENQDYFGAGVVEDIIGALSSLRELLVISRSSTIRYRANADITRVGRQLGVKYALSGSIRRAGARLRVSVELAETGNGAVVWGSHFDGATEDLFALQDQIATRVASTIAPQVREVELHRALRKRPDNLEAYDCVLRALAQLYRLNLEDFAQARAWLEKAIALDPTYAAPYAWLADWHSIRVYQGWSPDTTVDHAEVIRLATAAVERDSYDAMALALCGHAKSLLLHEFDEAIALFDRALAASPSSALAWMRSSPTYSYLGNAEEAIRRASYGIQLSPIDTHLFYPHTSLGIGYYVAGDHEEGARWGRRARDENTKYTANLRFLAANLAAAGRSEEAREVSESLLALEPGFLVSRFVESYPIQDPERRRRLADDLRRAGLPG